VLQLGDLQLSLSDLLKDGIAKHLALTEAEVDNLNMGEEGAEVGEELGLRLENGVLLVGDGDVDLKGEVFDC